MTLGSKPGYPKSGGSYTGSSPASSGEIHKQQGIVVVGGGGRGFLRLGSERITDVPVARFACISSSFRLRASCLTTGLAANAARSSSFSLYVRGANPRTSRRSPCFSSSARRWFSSSRRAFSRSSPSTSIRTLVGLSEKKGRLGITLTCL